MAEAPASRLRDLSPQAWAAFAGTLVVFAAISALWWLAINLLRQQGRLLPGLEFDSAPALAAAAPPGA